MVAYMLSWWFASALGAPVDDAQRQATIDKLYTEHAKSFAGVKSISSRALLAQLADDQRPVLVDVRPVEERRISTIPGAISLEQLAKMDKPDQPIVVFCTLGVRSGHEAVKLQKQGFDVINLEGSLLSWSHASGPLVTPSGEPTKRVHVYSKDWDFLSSKYESVVTDGDQVTVLRAPEHP